MANSEPAVFTGSHGAYLWLTTGRHNLHTLLQRCPHVVAGKYIAVTSQDSGPMFLTDEEKRAGWVSRNEIAYSLQIQSPEGVPHGKCSGFDEWYVFESSFDLGELQQGNVFEATMAPGQVFAFVNYGGFGLHNPEVLSLVDLFWKQMDWVQPESFISDGDQFLTFVSHNKDLFVGVHLALGDSDPSA